MTTQQLMITPPQTALPLYWLFVSQKVGSTTALEYAPKFAMYAKRLPLNVLCVGIQQRIEDSGLLYVCDELSECESLEDVQSALRVSPQELGLCRRDETLLLEWLKIISEAVFFLVAQGAGDGRSVRSNVSAQ